MRKPRETERWILGRVIRWWIHFWCVQTSGLTGEGTVYPTPILISSRYASITVQYGRLILAPILDIHGWFKKFVLDLLFGSVANHGEAVVLGNLDQICLILPSLGWPSPIGEAIPGSDLDHTCSKLVVASDQPSSFPANDEPRSMEYSFPISLPLQVFDPRYFKRTRYKTLRTGAGGWSVAGSWSMLSRSSIQTGRYQSLQA